MTVDTPAGTINQITPIREFVELTTITNAQYLLGIQNMSTGNGSKITFGNLITSLISGNADNKLVKGSDGKLFISTPIEIGTLANLTTTNKTNLVSAINELNSNMGSLSNLETTVKTSLVAAINSVAELTEPELLIDKVNQSKALVTGNVASYQEELEQIKLMKRSTYDLSKFTVVGNPTITDDGIASGFSRSNYIKKDITLQANNSIEYEFVVKLPNTTYATNRAIFNPISTSNNFLAFIYANYNYVTFNGFGGSSQEIKLGGTYKIRMATYSNGTFALNWTDMSTGVQGSKTGTNACYSTVNNTPLTITLGVTLNNVPQFPLVGDGSIDLKQFSITVDGKEVFSGNKTGVDTIKPDNYDVVGSPVISDDGVASGFSAYTTYIKTPIKASELLNKSWEIHSVVKANGGGMCCPVCFTQNYYGDTTSNIVSRYGHDNVYLNLKTGDSIDRVQLKYNDNYRFNIASYQNQTFEVVLAFDYPTGTYSFYFIDETGTKRQEKTYTPTSTNKQIYEITSTDNYIAFGGGINAATYSALTQYDLNAFKIYVDGNLVYQPCLKIPYYESSAQYGSKIVDVRYRERVLDAYQQGFKDYKYYTLDEENGNFTLPHGEIYGMLEQIRTENEQNNEAVRQIVDVKDNLYKILEGHQSTNKTLWDLITFTDNSEADNLLIGGNSPFTSNSSNSNFHFYLLNSIIGTYQPDDTAKLNVYKLFNKSHHDAQSDPIYVQDGTIVIACAKPTKLSKILLRSFDTYYTTPSIIHIHGANIANNMSRDITMTDFTSYAKYIGGISTTKEDTYTTPTNTNWGINRPIELTIDDKDTFNTFFISMSHWCSGQNGWGRRLVGVQVYGTQMTNDDSNYTVKMSGDYENCKWIASSGKIYNTDDLYQQYGYIPKEKVQLSRWISCFGSGIGQANATTRAADQYYPKYISGSISTTKNNGGQPWFFLRQTNYSAEPRPQVGYNVSGVGYLDISSTLNNQTVIDYTADSSFPIGEYYWEGTFGYNNSPTAHNGNTYMCGWCQLQKVYDDNSVEIIQTFSKEGSMYEPSVCYRTPRFYANRAFKKLRLIIKEMAFPNAAMILSQMQLYYRDTAGNIARSFIPNATQYDLSYNTVKHKSNVHFFITPTGVRVGSNCFIEKTDPTTKAACVGNRWINENTKKSYVCNTSGVWTEEDFCEIGCMTMFGSKHKGMRLRTVANSENPMQKYIQDQGDMGGNLALDYSLAVNASTVVTSSPTDPDFYFQAESKDENEGVEFSLPANTKTLQSYRRSLVKSKVYQGGQQFAHWSNCDHTGAILKAYKTFDTSAAGEYIEGSEEELQ